MSGFDEVFGPDGKLISSTPTAATRQISVEAFFQRFTAQEVQATTDSSDVRVVVLRNRLFVRTELIDLNSDEIKQAMLLLQSLKIITPERAKEITA